VNAADLGFQLEMMVVVTDPDTVWGRPPRCVAELGCDLADVRFRLPTLRVDVRLDDRLDAEFDGQLTDLILIPVEQSNVCRWRSQSILAKSSA